MGIIRSEFTFANPAEKGLQAVRAKALADTGAAHLRLPEHIAIQLNLRELEKREVTLANGQKITVPYAGPVEVTFKNRRCFTGAMIMGDEPLLGDIPMEDMDIEVLAGELTFKTWPGSTVPC